MQQDNITEIRGCVPQYCSLKRGRFSTPDIYLLLVNKCILPAQKQLKTFYIRRINFHYARNHYRTLPTHQFERYILAKTCYADNCVVSTEHDLPVEYDLSIDFVDNLLRNAHVNTKFSFGFKTLSY